MENAKGGQNLEDLESQEQPINANNLSSSKLKAEPERLVRAWKRSPEKEENESKKTAEALQAQAQAVDFWKKIYGRMKSVESKEQAENLFKGLSSSKRVEHTPAKIEARGESQGSEEDSRKASELRAREKALAVEGLVEVKVDATTPEMFPYVAKKLDEELYAPKEKILERRKRKCLCCSTERLWCTLILLIPIVVVVLVMYFVLLTPKDPTTSMEGVSISGFQFINSGVGAPRIETAMNFTVRLKNPNRFAEVIYERFEVVLTYRSTTIGSVSMGVAGYKQQERNLTLIEAQLPKTTTPIVDTADAEALKSDIAKDNVRMELRGIAEGHFKIARIKMGSFDTPVDCLLNIRPETSTERAVLLSASCYNRPR